MIEIDKILEKCGDFNRYQYILLLLFCLINMLSSMHYYSQTIISFVPDHWCYDERLKNKNIDEIKELKRVFTDLSCFKIGSNETCTKWVYNYDYGYHSMISELNWICDSAWKSTFGQSMFFIGSMIGSLAFGVLADVVGRLPILIIANMIAMIGNFLTLFANTLPLFAICRFTAGLATDSNFVMMYILVLEYVRPSMRTTGLSISIGVFYCLGSVLTPWIAVLFGDWKLFLIVTAIPFFIVPFYYFIVVESAEWLITKNKYDKAIDCFKKVAKINGKHLDESVFIEFKRNCLNNIVTSSSKNVSFLKLFETPNLRKNTFILIFKSMVITLCYDAISRNVEGLAMSPFVMFSLSSSAIFPACLVLILLQDKIGRKAMASSSLFISGIFTASTGMIIAYQKSMQNPYLLATLAIIGRFGVTIAYNSSAQYATELIPTCVRAQGVAAVHVAGYAFTFFSSYILFLQHYFLPLPAIILGTLSFLGAGLCLLLPETLNKTLPCSLEAGEEFGKDEKCFDFPFCNRKKQKTESITTLKDSTIYF